MHASIGKTVRYFALFAASAAALAGCTNTPASPNRAAGGSCFLASLVNNFNGNPDGTVDIQVGMGQYYRLTTDGTCPDIDWKNSVALKTRTGSDYVCGAYDAQFIIPNGMVKQSCNITAIAPLTKEQYMAARAAK